MSSSAQDPRPPTKQRQGRHEGFYPTNIKKKHSQHVTLCGIKIAQLKRLLLLSRLNIRCMQSPFFRVNSTTNCKAISPSCPLHPTRWLDSWLQLFSKHSKFFLAWILCKCAYNKTPTRIIKELRNQTKEGDDAKKVTTMSRYPCTYIQIVSLAAVFSVVTLCSSPQTWRSIAWHH